MKFYNREEELEILRRNREMSRSGGVFTVMTGRRRIGKTELIKESEKDGKLLYFFVPRSNETLVCEQLVADTKRDLGIDLINSGRFRDLFEQLMRYGREVSFTFVIDEFQELRLINRSITSSIQNHWDGYKSTSKINLIVCGSVQSLMKKMFEDHKEPLFGRATSKFTITPLRPSILKKILGDHDPKYEKDDLLFLYMVTGGVPKYIELLMDAGATSFKKMLNYICSSGSYFLTDGKDLLISEFGKDYGTYFSILQLIANGKNSLNEINTSTKKECGSYLEKLQNEYAVIKKNRPLFSKENSRDVRWKISDKYLQFYFRFISSNQSLIEMGRYDMLKEKIAEGYAEFSGPVLEDYFKEKIAEEERCTDIGSYWDRKGHNEIDIIILNDLDKKAAVIEVKRNPGKADIGKLKEKTATLGELNDYDVEYRTLSLKDM